MPHAVVTGPVQGSIHLSDGTDLDVSPAVVIVETAEQAAEVAHLIGERHQAQGHPWHDADKPFVHTSGA